MSFLKEFEVDNTAVEEWFMWGGITLPHVMQQKDGSCFSVIEYEMYEKNNLQKKLELPTFRRGWAMWNEQQHTVRGDRNFLVICWNPFVSKNNPYIENTLGEEIAKENFIGYFGEEVEKICREISKITVTKLLKYQEMMNFLSFTLTLEEKSVEMPEVPLYMDALLSQDVNFKFKANDIYVNGKKIFILSLSDLPDVWEIFEQIENFSYRYVRRILIFDEKESEEDLQKYTAKWCPNRKIMLKEIEREILSDFNGYFWNGILFLLEEKEEEELSRNLEKYFAKKGEAYIFEKYNLKDVWWGSLSGMYLANITPPIIGFESVEEFILHKNKKECEQREHRFKQILDDMETEKNV